MRFADSLTAQRMWIGAAIAALVFIVILVVLLSIQGAASDQSAYPVDIAHLIRMSAIQAGLSALLSVLVGIILAWTLNRRQFPGRTLLVGLLSAALVTPGITVAVGLIAVWGRAGWVNAMLEPFGLQLGSIFGLGGILYAHIILDATFAARILLDRLESIPQNRLKTGQSLNLSPWQRFATLDWPAMAGSIPGLAAIIFLLAFTSFPIVLLLGGGPANQTFEVAIYSAVRFDFDLANAVRLALVQLGFCAILVFPATMLSPAPSRAGVSRPWSWAEPFWLQTLHYFIIALAVLTLLTPLLAVIAGITGIGDIITQPSFWRALATSAVIGSLSAIVTLVLALGVAMARAETAKPWLRMAFAAPAYLYLVLPSVTLALGFFIATRNLGFAPRSAAPLVLILGNALLGLPYAIATLGPAFETVNARYSKLSRSLGLSSWQRLSRVEWPLMGRELGLVIAMSFCFSLGDLGVIALFGTENFTTLPWLMVRALGAYRTNDAATIAAILLLGTMLGFIYIPRLIERLSHAGNR